MSGTQDAEDSRVTDALRMKANPRSKSPSPQPSPGDLRSAVPGAGAKRALIIAALILISVALYLPALHCSFVNYDDDGYVTANPQVWHGFTATSLQWAFTTIHTGYWHPLTWLSLMLDHTIYGMNPAGYHLTNILLHAINAALVFTILRQMTGQTWRSAIVAALFAVHPLRVESVAWVAERKDVLSAMFGLLTIAAYAAYAPSTTRGRYWIVLILLALSLMAKPMLVTLPVVLLILDFWPLGRMGREHTTLRSLIIEKLPMFGIVLAVSVATFVAQHKTGTTADIHGVSIASRIANAIVGYGRYLWKMVDFSQLAVLYPLHDHWGAGRVAAVALLLIATTLLATWQAIRRPWFIVGWLWFIVMLLPVIGLVQSGAQSMADRYAYLPTLGLLIALAWSVPEAIVTTFRRRAIGLTALVCVISTLGLFTRSQLRNWHDSQTLFAHTIAVGEDSPLARNNLGLALAAHGHPDLAIDQFRAALQMDDSYPLAHANLGSALGRRGDFNGSIAELTIAVRLVPNDSTYHADLATTLLHHGDTLAAIDQYTQAIQLDPSNATAHGNLAVALAQMGMIAPARREFDVAQQINPDDAWLRKQRQKAAALVPALAATDEGSSLK
jgi:hypothetical protein